MGYWEISIPGSDTASDLNFSVAECIKEKRSLTAVLNLLRKELAEENSEWNTPGFVNVALVLTQGSALALCVRPTKPYLQLLEDVYKMMEKAIAIASDKKTKWPSLKRRREFVDALSKILGDLSILMNREVRP